MPLIVYRVVFLQAGHSHTAIILAYNPEQAVDIIWANLATDNPILQPTTKPMQVASVEQLGLPDEAPYPEILPDSPTLLAVIYHE